MKLPVRTMCKKVGMTPQNFYKSRRSRQRQKVDELFVKQLVRGSSPLGPAVVFSNINGQVTQMVE